MSVVTGRSSTSQRFLGVMYLIRALTPFIVILALGIVGVSIINELQNELVAPAQAFSDALSELETSIGIVQEELGAVSQDLAAATSALDGLLSIPDLVPEIPGSISIPELDIPNAVVPVPDAQVSFSNIDVGVTNISYPSDISVSTTNYDLDIPAIPAVDVAVPGLDVLDEELAAALAPVTSIFAEFNDVFSGVQELKAELEQIPESASEIAEQGEILVNGVQDTARKWRNRLLFVLVILLLLAVNYFILPSIDDFRRGLLLLRNQPVATTGDEVQ